MVLSLKAGSTRRRYDAVRKGTLVVGGVLEDVVEAVG